MRKIENSVNNDKTEFDERKKQINYQQEKEKRKEKYSFACGNWQWFLNRSSSEKKIPFTNLFEEKQIYSASIFKIFLKIFSFRLKFICAVLCMYTHRK